MRLIDADALMPNAEYKGRYDVVTAYDIANAPTIEPEAKLLAEIKIDKEDLEDLVAEKVEEIKETMLGSWIPCTPETMPKDGQNVLVSYKTSEIIHVCQYHNDGSVNPWYSYIDQCRAYTNVVVAWMPLPEPYQPKE